MKTFMLPDLGEGLPEAEIVTWHVKVGDEVTVDQPLLSVETAKAVVEVPSPYQGTITRLYAAEGELVETGKPLVDYDGGDDGGVGDAEPAAAAPKDDSGTVVGAMPTGGDEVVAETAIAGAARRKAQGRVKAPPAVRAQAKRLGINLADVVPTGKNGQITPADLQAHSSAPRPAASARSKPAPAFGTPERLRGPRRAMAQAMTASRNQVAACSLYDDADIHHWSPRENVTVRMIRAIAAGVKSEPALNGWYDGDKGERTLIKRIDLAMAVDTPEGLIVPVLRDVGSLDAAGLRAEVDRVKQGARERSLSPDDMRDPTITMSNFGMLAGRYGSVVIVPPMVAIVGAGGIRHDVVAVMGGVEVHRRIPLSLTFDHRCVTGGEACRFLAGTIADLELPS